jgi:hypothetical protein
MANTINDELANAMRAQFPDLRTTESTVLAKLLGTKSIAPWYAQYKEKRALEQSLPDAFAEAGLSAEMWAWATAEKQRRSAARKAHADAVKILATEYKQKVDIADRRRDADLASTDSALMDVIEAGFDQLPLKAQASVSAATDDANRKTLLDDAIKRFRQAKIRELYPEGVDKFDPNKIAASGD